MEYQQFLSILISFKKYNDTVSEANDVGIDLVEGKFSTSHYVENILETAIFSHYGQEGWEWVEWFIYENDYGQKGLKATSDGEPICFSLESLYVYLEKYHLQYKKDIQLGFYKDT
jgi:hypothetical protein